MIYIIGAGLAGLSCAVRLSRLGHRVTVFEAAPYAGGRCRSFYDKTTDCVIDNGNHLFLSGNRDLRAYLGLIGGRVIEREAIFYFMEVATRSEWKIHLNRGFIPWWIGDEDRRVSDTRLTDYLSFFKILTAGRGRTVVPCIKDEGILYERFWRPLTLAVLNTDPREGDVQGLRAVLRETFLRGSGASRPLFPRESLGESLIDPAVERIRAYGGRVVLSTRIRRIELGGGLVRGLDLGGERIEIGEDECVVVAVSASEAGSLLPLTTRPEGSSPIVNVHFRYQAEERWREEIGFMGLIGGIGEWVFFRRDTVSVTVSAAIELVDWSLERIGREIWGEVEWILGLDGVCLPAYRVIKERRATFLQTPANCRRRPGTRTEWRNGFLAGDWTNTGLPATLEGAVRSGMQAAVAAGEFTAERM